MSEEIKKALRGFAADLVVAADRLVNAIDSEEEPGEPPSPPPPPPSGQGFLVTNPTAGTWGLEGGIIHDWDTALIPAPLPFVGELVRLDWDLELEVFGSSGGLRNLFYLTRDKTGGSAWKQDVVLLVNRGGNGQLALSHTLFGGETVPARGPWPLRPGWRGVVSGRLHDGVYTVSAPDAGTLSALVSKVEVREALHLQLGHGPGDRNHPTNQGWRLLSFSARVG